jgi:hypothetical protein
VFDIEVPSPETGGGLASNIKSAKKNIVKCDPTTLSTNPKVRGKSRPVSPIFADTKSRIVRVNVSFRNDAKLLRPSENPI